MTTKEGGSTGHQDHYHNKNPKTSQVLVSDLPLLFHNFITKNHQGNHGNYVGGQ